MTPEILRDTRRLLAICEAIRRAEHTRDVIRERLRRREADARRCGARPTRDRSARGEYAARWIACHGADAWDADPWCWEVDFARINEAPDASAEGR